MKIIDETRFGYIVRQGSASRPGILRWVGLARQLWWSRFLLRCQGLYLPKHSTPVFGTVSLAGAWSGRLSFDPVHHRGRTVSDHAVAALLDGTLA